MYKDIKWNQQEHKIDFYKICSVFFFCAFVGWFFETLLVLVLNGEWTNRGYLFVMKPLPQYLPFLNQIPFLRQLPFVWGLPMIQIYGLGGVFMVMVFRRYQHHPVKVFFVGLVSLTILELLASYFCTEILHLSFWDYSSYPLNFQSRISLQSSILWGVLSVLAVKIFVPLTDVLYKKVKKMHLFKLVVWLLMLYVVICGLFKYWLFRAVLIL